MKLSRTIFGLATILVVAGLTMAEAQDKNGDDERKVEDKKGKDLDKKPRPSPHAKTVQDLELAHQLIRYGRQEKNAEALLLAAQILHRTPSTQFKAAFKVELVVAKQKVDKKKSDEKKADEKPLKVADVDDSPVALVAEAKKLSSSPQTEALAKTTEKMLQAARPKAADGPMTAAFTVGPMQTIASEPVSFKANERAEVFVSTGVAGALILEVIDEAGNLVTRDSVPGNGYRCTWTPRSTGDFRIRVINEEKQSFRCKIYVD